MNIINQAVRMQDASLSEIRAVLSHANRLETEGREIVHLEIGEPDFNTPENINRACIKALNAGHVHYPPIEGIPKLKEAIVDKLKKENGLQYDEGEIIVTNGVAQGIFLAIMAFINDGDEILVPDPGYLCYFTVPKIAGARIKTYALYEENEFQITEEQLEASITHKTRMIVITSPNNPTGSVLNINSLTAIANVAQRHNLIVVSDEIYEKLIYGGEPYLSIASLPKMKERTIVLNGFSKYYAMTGWRLGYIATDKGLWDSLMRLTFYNIASVNSFTQWGAVEALTGEQTEPEKMKAEYKKRRDFMVEGINKIKGLSCVVPDGAFYVFMNVKKTGLSSNEFSEYMLDKGGVATVPGTVFGKVGEGFVRLSYATAIENISLALQRIEWALKKLEREGEVG